MNFKEKNTYIFDLDGCVYSGNKLYTGANELMRDLLDSHKKIVVLSNNSNQTSESVRDKLLKMGLPVKDIIIVVATDLIGNYLLQKHGTKTVKIVGSIELEKSMISYGHNILEFESEQVCEYLVVGRDLEFSYTKLVQCCKEIKNGAKIAAPNLDLNHPGIDGVNVPETGALLAAISAASGVYEVESCGKPSNFAFEFILETIGDNIDDCVMIGDNLNTDILGAERMRIDTVWLSHNRKFPENSQVNPNLIVPDISHLTKIYNST